MSQLSTHSTVGFLFSTVAIKAHLFTNLNMKIHTYKQCLTRVHLDYVTQPCDVIHIYQFDHFLIWIRPPQDKISTLPYPQPRTPLVILI